MSNGNVFHGIDVHEDILEYMMSLWPHVPGLNSYWRNRGPIPEYDEASKQRYRPAIIQLDGDIRLLDPTVKLFNLKQPKMRPAFAVMSPEIYIILDAPGDEAANIDKQGNPYNPGQQLSYWHWVVKQTVENDPGLLSMVGSEGGVYWREFETDYKSGNTIGTAIGPVGCVRYDIYFVMNPPRS